MPDFRCNRCDAKWGQHDARCPQCGFQAGRQTLPNHTFIDPRGKARVYINERVMATEFPDKLAADRYLDAATRRRP